MLNGYDEDHGAWLAVPCLLVVLALLVGLGLLLGWLIWAPK